MRVRNGPVRAGLAALLLVAVGAALAASAPSSTPRAIEGVWQGSLQGMLRLVVHVNRSADGRLTASLDSPDQGSMGIPIDSVIIAGDSLRLELVRLRARFAGRFEASGDSITGAWMQGGYTLPLALKHSDKPVEFRRPQDPVPPYPYDTVEVSYPNRKAGITLAGTLTVPRGEGPFPAALLITGSGAENRDEAIFGHRPFLVLADHLTRHGVAVLRVDDRGVGGSTGSTATSTSEDFAGDVLAGIEFLSGRKEINPTRIGLIGHSEGGLIAPIVATRSKQVAWIVLMAGPGLPGDSILILQSAALRRTTGASEEMIARESAAHWRVHALLRAGADSAAMYPAVRALVAAQVAPLSDEQRRRLGDLDSLARVSIRPLLSPWFRFFVTYDPRPALQKVRCPVLALIGGKDIQVPAKENLPAIEAALKAGGNRDFTVREMPGLNHLFQTATTGSVVEYGSIQETIAPAALDTMSQWIGSHTAAKR